MELAAQYQPLIGSSTVVVLIDMQEVFLMNIHPDEREKLVDAQKSVINECAEYDVALVIVEFSDKGGTLSSLEDAAAHVHRVFRITKRFRDAFADTELLETLECLDAGSLLLMGVYATECVLATAKRAVRLGYRALTSDALIADRIMAGNTSFGEKGRIWYAEHGTFHEGTINPFTLKAVLDAA